MLEAVAAKEEEEPEEKGAVSSGRYSRTPIGTVSVDPMGLSR